MKKLIFLFLILLNFSCVKWFEVEAQITLEILNCKGEIISGQYVEYETANGTVRTTTDKNGKIKIDDYAGGFIFICVPSYGHCKNYTVSKIVTVKIC